MDLGIQGKVALVCAASRGIGKAVAASLAREGAKVAICARDEAGVKAAAAELGCLGVVADMAKPEDVDRLFETVTRELGPVDILVNNAGGPPPGGLGVVNDDQWRAGLELGLMSVIRLTRHVVPGMRERSWGRILTIASTTVQQPKEDLLISSTVRAGVAAFNKAIAFDLAKHNVLVHTVCPGPTATDRMHNLASTIAKNKGITEDEARAGLTADVPMGRMGRPEEVGDLVCFLASDRPAFSTGLTLAVDGGQVKSLLG